MRFLPIVLLLGALLVVVVFMTGDRRKGLQTLRNMLFTIAVMVLLAALFAVIADQST
jgi:hypothetical protein